MTSEALKSGGLVLEHSRSLRLFTLFILYVGQGMPIGLFFFAVPAWMAANGASAAEVGSVAALTALPWSLKLVNGFIMDRYTYLPMGRRRAWILAAQGVMIASLVIAALIGPAVGDVAILGAIGFTVNLATTYQDVAVDGLAVDIMTEDERARGSGMMFGGQSIGVAAGTALCGFVIEDFGTSIAFLIVAGLILALSIYIASIRERVGELDLIPVAAPAHPLARAGITAGESRRHLQLVLTDRSPLTEGREFSVLSPLTWRLGDLGAKHSLLREGLGWGNMPRAMVAADLASGALVELDLPEKPGAHYGLSAIWRRDTRLGPAASWLVDAFKEGLGG